MLMRRRRRDEKGASAVEFALIMPILFTLLFGIIEMGFLMKDYVSLSSAARAGARTASAAADAGPGICQPSPAPPCTPARAPALAQAAADAIQKTGTAIPTEDIDWVMIYRANSFGYPQPAGNKSLDSCSTDCVVYKWDKTRSLFRFERGAWNSTQVNACVNDGGRDTVGVAMQASHRWLMGLFDSPMVMREKTIMQFEPLEADRCKPGMPNAHP